MKAWTEIIPISVEREDVLTLCHRDIIGRIIRSRVNKVVCYSSKLTVADGHVHAYTHYSPSYNQPIIMICHTLHDAEHCGGPRSKNKRDSLWACQRECITLSDT